MKDGILWDRHAIAGGKFISGAELRAHWGGTAEPAVMYHDIDLKVPTTNPFKADASGYVKVYLDPEKRYDLRLWTPEGVAITPVLKIGLNGSRILENIAMDELPGKPDPELHENTWVYKTPEPEVREVVKEVIKPDPQDAARIAELEQRLADLNAQLAERDTETVLFGEPIIEDVPEEFADIAREATASGNPKEYLAKEQARLRNLRFLNNMTEADRAKEKKLDRYTSWQEVQRSIEVT